MRLRPRPLLLIGLSVVSVLAAAGGALAANGGFTPVEPASPNAKRIEDSYYLILGLTAFVFVVVEAALILFIVRFRSRGRSRDVEGPQIRGNTNLEIAWTVAPVLILAAIAAFVFYKLPGIEDVPAARAGGDPVEIRVVGHQFYWQFEYPDGQISIDRLVVPVGQVVSLEVVSPDVAHSWWIPALGGKIDALPGRTNHTWFRADRPGVYRGRCAELCGLEHASMKAQVEVVSRARYRRFLTQHAPASRTVAEEAFVGVCAKCHGPQGEGDYGPPLVGRTYQLADIKDLLLNGRRRMPAVGKGWSDAQIAALVRYLQSKYGVKGGA